MVHGLAEGVSYIVFSDVDFPVQESDSEIVYMDQMVVPGIRKGDGGQ